MLRPIVSARWPQQDSGMAESGRFPRTLARMTEARQRKGVTPVSLNRMAIDVGLIDIVVYIVR